MPEENKQGDNGELKPEENKAEETKELKLTITKNIENGQLSVQGPGNGKTYDKWTCYGLMDDAKEFIRAHNIQASQNRIVQANPSMVERVRGMFHK